MQEDGTKEGRPCRCHTEYFATVAHKIRRRWETSTREEAHGEERERVARRDEIEQAIDERRGAARGRDGGVGERRRLGESRAREERAVELVARRDRRLVDQRASEAVRGVQVRRHDGLAKSFKNVKTARVSN